ncbi:hypothetical protein BaRGS_00033880, partial [Batillaria attramentaria]
MSSNRRVVVGHKLCSLWGVYADNRLPGPRLAGGWGIQGDNDDEEWAHLVYSLTAQNLL